MILGGADHDEYFCAIEIRAAKLPERAADGVDHAGRHVHRAEAAVRGIVGCAELTREQAGQRLHLVAPGEQRKFFRVGRAELAQPLGEQGERLFPTDGLELARAALCSRLAQQWLRQPRRRILLHDAGAALGADRALVERVGGVAIYVTHLAVAQVYTDAAAARAHVARGGARFGFCARNGFRQRVVKWGQ
ncbi:MAG: hypothetical protein FD134_2071 [Gallionellaceae bacterium]|nr:MAG: hypothetical protein FD134_2071 [Gallionellaceae bacterium]